MAPPSEPAPELEADVKAYASSLGFAPRASDGAVTRGFDDRDFRAEHLRKKEAAAARRAKEKSSTTREDDARDDGERGRGKKRAQTNDARANASQKATRDKANDGKKTSRDDGDGDGDGGAAARERPSGKKRPWNPGAGPMPSKGDVKGGKSNRDGGANASASGGAWYEASEALDAELGSAGKRGKSKSEPTRGELEEKERMAKNALEDRVNTYAKRMQRHSDANAKWLEMVRTNGTASDKVAANVLSVTEDPAANLKALENLLGIVERARASGGKRGAVQSITALETLFRESLLPDRKLRYFSEQPLSVAASAPHERKRLMYWYVEDSIKRMYLRFIAALDELSRDPLPILKEKSLKSAYALLKSKPEGERQLLHNGQQTRRSVEKNRIQRVVFVFRAHQGAPCDEAHRRTRGGSVHVSKRRGIEGAVLRRGDDESNSSRAQGRWTGVG